MMKIMGSYRFQFPKKIFPLLLLIASSPAGAESTIETNLAERIKDSEFNALWGLGAIGADYAYAAGYTGKGIAIGVLDEAVFFILNLMASCRFSHLKMKTLTILIIRMAPSKLVRMVPT
ncbi:hypothetical protein QNH14_09050 [Apirhabdus apintestini]|nr:hypothetical protein QNH14_09050 [Enterobacteriaceae bacterium CA-0114]